MVRLPCWRCFVFSVKCLRNSCCGKMSLHAPRTGLGARKPESCATGERRHHLSLHCLSHIVRQVLPGPNMPAISQDEDLAIRSVHLPLHPCFDKQSYWPYGEKKYSPSSHWHFGSLQPASERSSPPSNNFTQTKAMCWSVGSSS